MDMLYTNQLVNSLQCWDRDARTAHISGQEKRNTPKFKHCIRLEYQQFVGYAQKSKRRPFQEGG